MKRSARLVEDKLPFVDLGQVKFSMPIVTEFLGAASEETPPSPQMEAGA